MDIFSNLIQVISAIVFASFQQIAFKKYSGKFRVLPLITAIILIIAGVIGYIATLFGGGMEYFLIMGLSGLTGIIVCSVMLIAHKPNTKKKHY